MKEGQPNSIRLTEKLGLTIPLIGLYDAPDPAPFSPLDRPAPGECVFVFYRSWLEGRTLHLTEDRFGCGGCGRWMFDVMTRSRESFVSFLFKPFLRDLKQARASE